MFQHYILPQNAETELVRIKMTTLLSQELTVLHEKLIFNLRNKNKFRDDIHFVQILTQAATQFAYLDRLAAEES